MEALNHTSGIFGERLYLTDGGLETSLIFQQGIPLNHFAAFELLAREDGRKALQEYYQPYLALAEKYMLGFMIESPTWRANADWGFKLGYTHDELFALNRQSIAFIRGEAMKAGGVPHVVVSGNIGPRGDGYRADILMTPAEARAYHLDQIKAFALADVDVVTAMTINYGEEAIGIINAARSFHLPVVISFTVETDGQLPGGETLQSVIERTDKATGCYATHYMINCAHPRHFMQTLKAGGRWISRLGGIRANASIKSHAELDASDSLDAGDKCLLAAGYVELAALLQNLKVVGGCCGTDAGHLEEICRALK